MGQLFSPGPFWRRWVPDQFFARQEGQEGDGRSDSQSRFGETSERPSMWIRLTRWYNQEEDVAERGEQAQQPEQASGAEQEANAQTSGWTQENLIWGAAAAATVGVAVLRAMATQSNENQETNASPRRRSQRDLDNHANQLNPNNQRYQGGSTRYRGAGTPQDLNNHANQLNPNNRRYSGRR